MPNVKFNTGAKAEIITQDEEKSIVRVLVTSNGSSKKKDLHGEFFHPETYFGDELVTVKYGLYEHLMNSVNNPFMPMEKQILGKATLAKVDEWGRWFDFEIKRSLEYHDFLMAMVSKGMMGASTQCLPNGKKLDPKVKGKINYWLESEVSLTPTPADPTTIGEQIIELAKSFGLKLRKVDENGQVVDVEETVTPPAPDEETEEEFDADEYAATIAATLSGEDETKPDDDEEEQDDAVAADDEEAEDSEEDDDITEEPLVISDEVEAVLEKIMPGIIEQVTEQATKAAMSVFFEIWGSDIEEAKDAILTMMGGAKAVNEVLALVKRTDKKADGVLKSFTTFAHYMKNFREGEAGRRFAGMSPKQRQMLNDIEDYEDEDYEDEELEMPKGYGRAYSRIPAGAPGSQ